MAEFDGTVNASTAVASVAAGPVSSADFAASIARMGTLPTPYRVLNEDGEQVGPLPALTNDELVALYRWMLLGRLLDERGLQLQRQGRLGIWGPTTGQEAAQAGLGQAMGAGDWVFPSYRECITLLMRGLDMADLLAYLRGVYWLANPLTTGVFPVQILIGDQSLHAVGAGMGFKLQGQKRVAIGSIGDGATSQGDFHEALNFAGVFKAQAVLFIQNNQWAISLPRSRQTASETLAQKALAYGLPGVLVDGNDVLAVYTVAHWAIERARSGEGAALVEALTYRMGAHTTADDPTRYQPTAELDLWRSRDPLARMRRFLERGGLWNQGDEEEARRQALARIDAAVETMERRPLPATERLFETTFATPTRAQQAQRDWSGSGQ